MIKVGLDIGNSKISCVVCDLRKNQKPKILSFVSFPTLNVNKSALINYNAIKSEVKKVIDEAAKDSQTEIKSINLNLPLSKSNSNFYSSSINIENELINDLHLKKAVNQSSFFENSVNEEIIMNFIMSYEVDDKVFFENPIGNFAKKLNLNFYKLSVDQNLINTYKNLFKELNIYIEEIIPTPLSSALATLNGDDKDLGAICVDLGESSTSISIFENNKFVFGDSIGVGSNNVTLDIARGVSTTISSAERLKTLYGSVLNSPSDEYEIIEVPLISSEENQFKQISRSTINLIIKPRVEENLELVWQKLKQYNLNRKKIKNLILTGGGSQLEGISEYAQVIFDSNVRLGKPFGLIGLDKKYTGPQYSQTVGSVLYKKDDYDISFLKKSQKNTKNTYFSRFSTWLDQYI